MKKLLIIFLMILFSCGEKKSEQSEKAKPIQKIFSKETCVDESCAEVILSWPEFENDERGKILNQEIRDQLLTYFYPDSAGLTLEQQAELYFKNFNEAKKEFPDMPGDWAMEVNASVSFDSMNTISVFFEEYNFSGGAHPNSSLDFLNFDRESGEFLSRDQLILDQSKLLVLAERAFREFHEVEDSVSLAQEGRFFLPETGFFLPNTMGFKEDKFLLIYIPYEIGPYAMGYTDLELPLADVQGIVRM